MKVLGRQFLLLVSCLFVEVGGVGLFVDWFGPVDVDGAAVDFAAVEGSFAFFGVFAGGGEGFWGLM